MARSPAQGRDPPCRAAADAAADGAAVDDRLSRSARSPCRWARRRTSRCCAPTRSPGSSSRSSSPAGDHDEPIDSQRVRRPRRRRGARARAHQPARRHGADHAAGAAAHHDRRRSTRRSPSRSRGSSAAQETPADPAELDDLVARVVVRRGDARRAGRPHPRRGAADPQDERLRSGAVRRPRGDEHELPHLRQGRGAAAARRRPAAALHPRRGSSAKWRARA